MQKLGECRARPHVGQVLVPARCCMVVSEGLRLRVDELVPLFFALQALDALLVHLLGHLLISFPLRLGFALVLDRLHSSLNSLKPVPG